MIQPKPKIHHRYIFYRLYVLTVYGGALVWGVFWIASSVANTAPSVLQIVGFGVLFPFFAVAVFMLFSVFLFPFDYSVFGGMERTPFPTEAPVLQRKGVSTRVGFFNFNFCAWYVFPSGLGISITGVGRAFIPVDRIMGIADQGVSIASLFAAGRYMLEHSSPEMNSPIYFRDESVFDALRTMVERGDH